MSHRRRREASQQPPRCAWTVNNWKCRYRVADVMVGGLKMKCRFCAGHQCMKNIRCTARFGGTRCLNYVKDLDANKYKYCAQLRTSIPAPIPHPTEARPRRRPNQSLDNCPSENCNKQRATNPETETDLRYCLSHRCPQPACRNEKTPLGPYCPAHTCAGDNCTALASGDGDPGSHASYCDRHRVCLADGCARLCHIRESGAVAPFCGMHYCRSEGCPRDRRAGDEACPAHSCLEAGCGRRSSSDDAEGGSFCKSHECKWPGCFFRRRRGEWCAEHVCARRGCEGGVEGSNEYCGRHQPCVVVGCEKDRLVVGDKVLEKCEDHDAAACASAGCTKRAAPKRLFCAAHLCATHDCRNPALSPLTLCDAHKCALPHCAAPRWLHTTMPLSLSLALSPSSSPFCAKHACHYPSCREMAEAGAEAQRCQEHMQCRAEGCRRFAARGSDRYCGEHRRRRGYMDMGYQDQWANWGVAI
ncbi:uncharacterized protein DNG_06555 [Cephalotrichum gorgonifer]|uniref:Uncharacterized protein n=1 Tax=Cephalotrichum gorgonifer TaxID=2041049 RepID=A0AAE8SXE7_9PEZI|nr:uncharacterized protein DNG_06555 [Cephalotrichum gorgonifer]